MRASILCQPGLYWPYLGGGYGNAGMRPERRPSSRNGGGGASRPDFLTTDSGGKALNPRGLGTASPSKTTLFRSGSDFGGHLKTGQRAQPGQESFLYRYVICLLPTSPDQVFLRSAHRI